MKSVLFLGLIFVCLQIKTNSAALTPLEQSCVDELRLNQATIERWNSQPFVPEDNVEFNKFMGCYWKKRGYQKENGEINYDNLKVLMQGLLRRKYSDNARRAEEVANNIISVCRNTPKGGSDGATASKVSNCVIRNIPRQ